MKFCDKCHAVLSSVIICENTTSVAAPITKYAGFGQRIPCGHFRGTTIHCTDMASCHVRSLPS
eukprot:scaffold62557_cov49-Prasinocladus_malaysianus.AAC.2